MSISKRKTKTGEDRFDVLYRGPDGRERSKTFRTRRDARAFESEQQVAMRKGVWTDPKAGRVTLADWSEQWLAGLVSVSNRTQKIYEDNVRLHLLPDVLDVDGRKVLDGLGSVELGKLTTAQLSAWVAAMGKKPRRVKKASNAKASKATASKGSNRTAAPAATLAPATVDQAYRVLRSCLEAAVTSGHLGRNPMDGVKRPKVDRKPMRFLTEDEVDRVADEVADRYRALVLVAAYGGLRMGELLALRWENVDALARSVRVEEQTDTAATLGTTKPPKTAAGRRTVSLPRWVVAELVAHGRRQHATDEDEGEGDRDGFGRLRVVGSEGEPMVEAEDAPRWSGLVFRAPDGGPIDPSNLRHRVWEPAVAAAGLAPTRFHDLRHTCASLAIAAGADILALQAMLGHASAAMTLDRYGHLMPGKPEAVADRLDAMRDERLRKRSAAS